MACVEEGEGGATEGFAGEFSGGERAPTGEGGFCVGGEEDDAGGIGFICSLFILIIILFYAVGGVVFGGGLGEGGGVLGLVADVAVAVGCVAVAVGVLACVSAGSGGCCCDTCV